MYKHVVAPIEPNLGGWECTKARDTSGHSKQISEKIFEWSQEWDVKELSHSLAGSDWNASSLVYVVREQTKSQVRAPEVITWGLPDGLSRWLNGLLLLRGGVIYHVFLKSDPQLGVTVIFAAPGKSPGKSPGKFRRIIAVIVSEMTIPTYRGAVNSLTAPR